MNFFRFFFVFEGGGVGGWFEGGVCVYVRGFKEVGVFFGGVIVCGGIS